MDQSKPIRVAVIGAGSFGRNHARVYRELKQVGEPVELVAVIDRDPVRAHNASQPDANPYRGVEVMLNAGEQIDAASVAVPTVEHLAVARELLEAGIDVLIEKPLASSLEEVDEIAQAAASSGRIVQVGHLERFNPGVQAAAALVTTPMFFEVHRLSVFSPRALDVDVVLDLMIHDLDIVLSFVRSPLREVRAVGIPILSDKIDIANARLEFENGCVANLTASRVSTEQVRKLRFFQPHQYVSVDYGRQDVFSLSVEPGKDSSAAPAPPGLRIVPSKPPVQGEEPLRAELRSFLQAVRNRTQPVVSLADGRNALAAALEIHRQIEEHHRRTNLGALVHSSPAPGV